MILDKCYKTYCLCKYGKFTLVALLLLLLGGYFIPEYSPQSTSQQMMTLKGIFLKYDDKTEVSQFYQSIKQNNGFLVLGTSESTSLKGGNYYDYLNNDSTIPYLFSVLSGAGRTCGIHIPVLLKHWDELDSLKVIYFINPVYWREGLNKITTEYWRRYCNYKICFDVTSNASPKEKDLLYPVQEYIRQTDWFSKGMEMSEFYLRNTRRNYFHHLRYRLFAAEYDKQFSFISIKDNNSYPSFGFPQIELIDTLWNIEKSFHYKEWFKPIDASSDFRYKELQAFINVCQKSGIQLTCIVGPYNGKFIQQYSPSDLKGYQETVGRIKKLLQSNHVDYIDMSDISFTTGAFKDHQHHSVYGAYLIYQRIKSHFL